MPCIKHDIAYYKIIHGAHGSDSAKQTTVNNVRMKMMDDWEKTVNWEQGTVINAIREREQKLLVMKTTDVNIKKVEARPGEPLRAGELVKWRDGIWLINKMDTDNQFNNAGTMYLCNAVLRWQDDNGKICQIYGWAQDATKYGTGVVDTQYIQLGEFSLKINVPITEDTLRIKRDKRFLFGKSGNGYRPTAYVLTRVNQVTSTYVRFPSKDGTIDLEDEYAGYLEFTMLEDVFRDTDNIELMIADYRQVYTDEGGVSTMLETDRPSGTPINPNRPDIKDEEDWW